jgi:Na+-driven multidrug efflux pump
VGLSGSPSESAANIAALGKCVVQSFCVGPSGSPSDMRTPCTHFGLGPATTFFDGATYLFCFLNVATTNLYSSARAQTGPNSPKAESVVRTAAQVAMTSGCALMIFLLAFCRPLLRLYMGDKAASTPGLLDAASDYVMIRSLSMPTSLLLGVLQAALLGAKDSVTPLIAILYATIVNVIGDYTLCRHFKMGLRGAAIATTLAQWASTWALIRPARAQLVKNHDIGLWKKKTAAKTGDDTVTGKAFLAFAAPVLTLIVGKLAAFGFMTHSAAAVPGQPTPLASHQILLSLLFFCSPFLEVISQTAQTFLPPFLAPVKAYTDYQLSKDATYEPAADDKVQEWLSAAQSVASSLLRLGVLLAAVVASVASLIPARFGHFITSDGAVQEAVKPLAKYLWMGAFFWAPVAVAEGVLLARRELGFLASVYLVSTALLPPALLQVKFRKGDVGQVWACFTVFQIFRATLFTSRIWGGRLLEIIKRRKRLSDVAAAKKLGKTRP